jgi:UDP-N-acetylglucosamine 2-epimerase
MNSSEAKKTVFICIGTRPDIIKMSPIIEEIKNYKAITPYVCASGQHKELANNIIEELDIPCDSIFQIMKYQQTPDYVLSTLLKKFTQLMIKKSPDLVMIHGDTATALAGSLAAFYLKIPIFHIEAGFRTYSEVPFPEEHHRRLITNCANYFACPDPTSVQNLISEKINTSSIFLTGNSISDVLYNSIIDKYQFQNSYLEKFDYEKNIEIVVTLHRSETDADALRNVCSALRIISNSNPLIKCFWPVHPNPRIKNLVEKELEDTQNIRLLPPIGVRDMHNLLFRASLILTDSAGVQEEAFLLEKPTLVLRERTERLDYLDTSRSKLFNPRDPFLPKELEKIIHHLHPHTDFYITDKLYSKTGASRKIAGILVNILGLDI